MSQAAFVLLCAAGVGAATGALIWSDMTPLRIAGVVLTFVWGVLVGSVR